MTPSFLPLRAALWLISALTLTGCASDMSHRDLYGQIPGLWHAITRPGQLPKSPTQQMTSQDVTQDSTLGTQLHMSLPDHGWSATFTPGARSNGHVTWQAGPQDTPRAKLILRDGVIVATQGLGDDLIASDIRDLVHAKAGGTPSGQREYHYLRGNGDIQSVVFICDYARTAGRVVEQCSGARRNITNTYADQTSRQWLGPNLGYAEITWSVK